MEGKNPRKTEWFILATAITFVVGGIYLLLSEETVVQIAPDFSLLYLEGNTFRLSDFRGMAVIIDFMATWCGPCRVQMPHLKVIWEKYGGKIVLISIDIDPGESEDTLKAFIQQYPYATWIWARDTANLARAYQVYAIPKTVIIDPNGYIRFDHTGVTEATKLIQEIDLLIG